MPGDPPQVTVSGSDSGGPLSIDFGIWDFTWRSIVLAIGMSFLIPIPWALVWYLKWLVPCVKVPQRPNLGFMGSAMPVALGVFGVIVLMIVTVATGFDWLNFSIFPAMIVLNWLFLKWLVAGISSDGQPLGLRFSGSFWASLGWVLLANIASITIIGVAWVYAAWTRWFCRNIAGARREVIFNGTGLEFLWRGVVSVIAASFVIPIPWVYRWMSGWMASQTVLVERGPQPGT
ncbi:hypothetical protein [Bradyrhizobium oropedii]|uniref:hypothetical protein n=1 Tax=Bradyrhizobium oropedii TaxID=1571201 RepID=UPI0030842E05